MSRRPIVAGNWKMHHLRADAEAFCRDLRGALGYAHGVQPPTAEVLLFPSFPLLPVVAEGLAGVPAACGGQDVHPATHGAHTGDVSAAQLRDAGAAWALCGHSERRADHGEGDELVGAKARAASERGLVPLICLGESGEDRRQGRTFEVLGRQLRAALTPLPATFELAYEPVWAIGTGDTATPELAQEAHAFLRSELAELCGADRAAAVRILYGGSAKPGNAGSLFDEHDIDGFLVGGASLDSQQFLAIIGVCGERA